MTEITQVFSGLFVHSSKSLNGKTSVMICLLKTQFKNRTSLVVEWLRIYAPNAGAQSLIPGQGTRAHMAELKRFCMSQKEKKIEDPMCHN